MSVNISYWLDRATSKIRFAPDREVVRRELEGHIQDRMDAYLAKGMDRYDAGRAVVADMGDPDEIAAELGRIHAPWWGYLWRLSRWALVIAALWLAVSVWNEREYLIPDYGEPLLPGPDVGTHTYVNEYGVERTVDMLAYWEPEGSVTLRGYRFTVPMVWVEHWEYDTPQGGPQEVCRMIIGLKSTVWNWRLWERSSGDQWMILNHTVTDNNGQRYLRENEEPDRNLFCSTFYGGPLSMWYEIDLDLDSPEDIPDWVDIPVGYSGDVLRLDLKNGEVMLP